MEQQREGQQFRTSDIALAAYLMIKGLTLVEAGREGRQRNGQHFYIFEDPDGKVPKLSIEFVNSPEASYDAAMRKLKKIVYG